MNSPSLCGKPAGPPPYPPANTRGVPIARYRAGRCAAVSGSRATKRPLMRSGAGRVAVICPSLAARDATMVTVSSAALFARSGSSFVELLGRISDDQWELPALGVWTVRSLAGHTARAILTVESYLNQEEPGDVTIPSAEAYYSSVFSQFTDAAAV